MDEAAKNLQEPLLSDEEQDTLLPHAHRISYPKGAVLMRAGEHSDYVLYLREGQVKSCLSEPRTILGLHGPGSLVGELAPLTGRHRSADIVALTTVEVLHIPGDVFLKLHQTNPKIGLAVSRQLARRVQDLGEEREDSFLSSERKLARAMLRIIESGIAEPQEIGTVIAGFSQTDLADLAGISRESVSGVLKQLKARDTVSTGRERFVVHDIPSIESLAMRRDRSLT